MSEFTEALLVANIYRYLLICAGVAFTYIGYRPFVLGYFEKAGELKAAFGEHHIVVKQVAPGVFFAFLGLLTIAVGAYRRIEVSVPAFNAAGQWICEPTAAGEEHYEGHGPKSRKGSSDVPRVPQ